MSHEFVFRQDGWWIRFPEGEEAGPFETIEDAEAFLEYVDRVRRAFEENDPPKGNPPAG